MSITIIIRNTKMLLEKIPARSQVGIARLHVIFLLRPKETSLESRPLVFKPKMKKKTVRVQCSHSIYECALCVYPSLNL